MFQNTHIVSTLGILTIVIVLQAERSIVWQQAKKWTQDTHLYSLGFSSSTSSGTCFSNRPL